MKYLYLILLTSVVACSKSKTDPNAIPLSMAAQVVENKWWLVTLSAKQQVNCTGTATVEWDVYNDQNALLYKKSATIDFVFSNSQNATPVKTTVQGANSMSGKNGKIKSITSTGGYKFSY